jgi:hypothetical protein
MKIGEVSAMQTDGSTNAFNCSVLLAFKIQRIQATVKKFCLNKCLVGHWLMTTYKGGPKNEFFF